MEDNFVLGGSSLLNTGSEADDTHVHLKERVAFACDKWQQCMVKFVEAGMETGEFRPDAVPAQIAFSILSLVEGGLVFARITNDMEKMDQIFLAADQMIRANMTAKTTAFPEKFSMVVER